MGEQKKKIGTEIVYESPMCPDFETEMNHQILFQ